MTKSVTRDSQLDKLYKNALLLAYFTVGYNVIEAIASILAGRVARSIALIGFGLDSVVESLSGLVMIWRLRVHGKISEEEEEKVEKEATTFVGLTFFILGAYVLLESIKKIALKDIPDPSIAGIIIAVLSIIIMPLLGYKKYKIGKDLNLPSLMADSKETLICSILSVALLIGLMTRYLFNFWLSDPIVGVFIVIFLVKEGMELIFEHESRPDD